MTTRSKAAAAAEDATTLPLEQNLSYRLAILNFLMSKCAADIYGAHGLNSHQWKLLGVLFRFAPMSAAQVTTKVTFDKAAVSRAVRELLKAGLIRRRLHPTDGRTIEIRLSPRGTAAYVAMAAAMRTLQDELTKSLTATERQSLFSAIEKLETSLRAKEP